MKHISIIIAIVCLVTLAALAGIQHFAEAQSQAKCHVEAGGAKFVAESGCEYEFQSGSILDIQAGATAALPASILGESAVLQYPTPGVSVFCNTSTFTATQALTSATHTMATPVLATCTIAEDIVGDATSCSYTNSAGTITIKTWKGAATPVASAAGHAVSWCVLGTR